VKLQTVDLMPLAFRAELGSVDVEKRTVDLIFSTGAAVNRYDWASGKRYREVLSMESGHVRLQRLNTVGNLLDSHSAWSVGDVLGAVEPGSARLEKGKGLATVRFSKRDSVEPVFQDVRDKILRSVSVGYNVYRYVEDAGKDGQIPTRTAIDWEPYEISLVPMPADIGATVRSKSLTHPCVIELRRDDADRLRRFRLARSRH
jgi:Caudovirus prohead serine protease